MPSDIKKLDQLVINRIAAGEVIQRPINVVKELLENSIDAGANRILIQIKSGGFKLIQVQDNGCGIRSEDLSIVCERFTTSKLESIEDLQNMQTFGFRGEALASISHISHVLIRTKTKDDVCGSELDFVNGIPKGEVRSIASNCGTMIKVEDLFYNVPLRLAAFKSPSNEFNLISDLVAKYALQNSGNIGFSLKKVDDNSSFINTMITNSLLDNVKLLYDTKIAKDLVELPSTSDDNYKFSVSGYVSNKNATLKKTIFILFINNRLVECTNLKKSIETIYCNYLDRNVHPFIYLDLRVDVKSIDVNVHPTKSEVRFLYEEEICEQISKTIESLITKSEEHQVSDNNNKVISVTDFVTAGELMKQKDNKENRNVMDVSANISLGPATENSVVNRSVRNSFKESVPKTSTQIRKEGCERKIDEFFKSQSEKSETVNQDRQTCRRPREIKLASVNELRKQVEPEVKLQEFVRNLTFVGCADEKFVLVQHEEKLLVINFLIFFRELCYQIFLRDFGNFRKVRFQKSFSLKELAQTYFDFEEDNLDQSYNSIEEECNKICQILFARREMLKDYFAIEINEEKELLTVPLLLDDYLPCFAYLPNLICSLAKNVNWFEEKPCFADIGKVIAEFYSAKFPKHDTEEEFRGWTRKVETVVFPAFKTVLVPTSEILKHDCVHIATDLTSLAKTFERC